MAWWAAQLVISLWALATATAASDSIPDRSFIPLPSTIDLSGARLEAGRTDGASRPSMTQHDRHQGDRFSSSARSTREFHDDFVVDIDRGQGAEVTTEDAKKSLYGGNLGESRAQRRTEHDVLVASRVEMDSGTVVNGRGTSAASGVDIVGQRAWRRLNVTGEVVAQAGESDDDDEVVGGFGSAGLLAFVVCFGLLFCVLEGALTRVVIVTARGFQARGGEGSRSTGIERACVEDTRF